MAMKTDTGRASPPDNIDDFPMPDETAAEMPTAVEPDEKKYPGINSLAGMLEGGPEHIDLKHLPPAPVEIFPPDIQRVIREVSQTKCIPHEMTLSIVLALASACVGRGRGVAHRKDWREHANLFLVLVAESGAGKSHAMKYIFGELLKIQGETKAKFKRDYLQYIEDVNAYKKSKDPDKKMPVKPINIQYTLGDSTMEAASERMEDNPKGLLWNIDEMSGFFSRLDKYNKAGGSDGKSRLLSAWNAEEWNTSRKSKDGLLEERYIAKGAMGIFGGIQPHHLTQLFTYDDVKQGLPQRFAYVRAVVTEPMRMDTPEIPAEIDVVIENITRRMIGLEMPVDQFGTSTAKYLTLEPDARAEIVNFGDLVTSRSFGTEGYSYAVKMAQMLLRFALILHILEWAAGDKAECPAIIGFDTAMRAIKLTNWLLCHTEAIRPNLPVCEPADLKKMERADKRQTEYSKLLDFIAENQDWCSEWHTAGEILGKMGKPKITAIGFGKKLSAWEFPTEPRRNGGAYKLFPLPERKS